MVGCRFHHFSKARRGNGTGEMFLDQTYTPHRMVEERGKGGERQDKAVGWLGGGQVDFVIGIDMQRLRAADRLHGWTASALSSVRGFVTAGGGNARNATRSNAGP